MIEKLKERALLFRVRTKKDKEAFGQLYDLYVEKIYRFTYFKISNKEEAEDLVSEVFLKTWNYLMENTEKEIESFSGLIYRIARNGIIDFYRRRARQNEVSLENQTIEIADEGQKQKVETEYEAEKIMALIKKMKQDYQEVLILKYVEELSVSEIAQIVNRTRTGVRVTLHRAMKKLKELSGERG